MPKELIHFTIAERTATLLADTRYAPLLDSRREGLLLGSVFHDAMFYATGAGKPLESLTHRLHGAQGQDTFSLIRMQATHAVGAQDKSLPIALLVGMISHLYADVTMHPMVYHFTGDYYADDSASKSLTRQRHRALESLMDMVACPDMLGRAAYTLRLLLRRCPDLNENGLPIQALAQAAEISPHDTVLQLTKAWKTFAIFQSLAFTPWIAQTAFGMRPYVPRIVAELSTLLYAPQLQEQANFLAGALEFRHPVTGNANHASLDDLMNTAAREAEAMCRRLEPTLFDGAPLDISETGPSMDAGLSGVATDAMLHFADTPFPRLA